MLNANFEPTVHILTIGPLESFLLAITVLFLGHGIKSRVTFLKRFNIPEPIVGGLVVATCTTILHFYQIELQFTLPLQNIFMLMFFASVGLSANYKQLVKGGTKVLIFLVAATLAIILQNALGVSLATLLGLDPLMGLIAGSVTLSGGHGTGAAWAEILKNNYGLTNTLEIAMASATFGLIAGGIIGSPVANRLLKKHQLESPYGRGDQRHQKHPPVVTYNENEEDRLTAKKFIEVLFVLLLCVTGAKYLELWISSFNISWLTIPDFVYALFIGVIVTNLIELRRMRPIDTETMDILGTVSLSLFLAMALMSLKLWNIFDLAIPFLIILLLQTVLIALFTYYVTFRIMGKNYDAAVISSGHCGFGLGATPTAVMNMGSIVNHFGPSPQAFMIVPIVGAFFIDMVNLLILQAYLWILG